MGKEPPIKNTIRPFPQWLGDIWATEGVKPFEPLNLHCVWSLVTSENSEGLREKQGQGGAGYVSSAVTTGHRDPQPRQSIPVKWLSCLSLCRALSKRLIPFYVKDSKAPDSSLYPKSELSPAASRSLSDVFVNHVFLNYLLPTRSLADVADAKHVVLKLIKDTEEVRLLREKAVRWGWGRTPTTKPELE